MGKLKVLPANIANMIAAGEVVQRPASVVKEMMENAVDAGANQISVVIADAGRTLIQIIDNGCGMSPDDALVCFERHATSKITTAEDLEEILTYGFRGEALASIAAVAEVTLKTRRAEDEVCTQVTLSPVAAPARTECAGPVGSSFAVRNLFFNTPARRKFLKSDNVEFKHIVDEFTRIALTRPDLGFTLTHNGREVFVLKKAKSLKYRILDILGPNVVGDIVDIDAQTSVVRVSGFIGRPDSARKTLGNQFFFINGRYFRSSYLHKAVMKAYEEMMPQGLTPSYFIYLEADPRSVDVNIHPTKAEIKFEDDSVIFQILYACVRETLGKNSFGASIDFDTEGSVELPAIGKSFDQYRPQGAPVSEPDPYYDPFASAASSGFTGFDPMPSSDRPAAESAQWQHIPKREDYGALFEEKTLPTTQTIILQGKYIVTPVADGLMVVNVRRARERILYDRALKALSANRHVTQTALFPVEVQVGVAGRLLFDENAEMLASLGFDISASGNDSVVVSGVPEGFSCESGKVEQMVSDLEIILSEGTEGIPEMVASSMAQKIAMLGAGASDNLSSPMEARNLLDTLFASENAELTSSGRRIVTILPTEELEKRF